MVDVEISVFRYEKWEAKLIALHFVHILLLYFLIFFSIMESSFTSFLEKKEIIDHKMSKLQNKWQESQVTSC